MMVEKAKVIFYLGVCIFLAGVAGLILPILSPPWPYVLAISGLFLINAGLFVMGETITNEKLL